MPRVVLQYFSSRVNKNRIIPRTATSVDRIIVSNCLVLLYFRHDTAVFCCLVGRLYPSNLEKVVRVCIIMLFGPRWYARDDGNVMDM